MSTDLLIRVATLIFLTVWRGYWHFGKAAAEKEKPKTASNSHFVEYVYVTLIGVLVLANLLGYVILAFENLAMRVLGLIFVISGFTISMAARKTLAANWAEAYEYQIKSRHELVTDGMYKLARHPIYGGLLLMVPGSLMAAGSMLFIPLFVFLVVVFNRWAWREERLLLSHFGSKYRDYMRRTKKFIPYLY